MDVKLAESDADIAQVFPVMRELRPHLESAEDFLARVRRQQTGSGWRLVYVEDQGVPVAAAGFRISEWLAWDKALYVDDLICMESHRGKGAAEALMHWMEDHARAEGCAEFHQWTPEAWSREAGVNGQVVRQDWSPDARQAEVAMISTNQKGIGRPIPDTDVLPTVG